MKILHLFFASSLPIRVNAFHLFKAASQTYSDVNGETLNCSNFLNRSDNLAGGAVPSYITPKFDLTELLDSRARKPEIYAKAMLELKRLEEEPLCHRVAAQLLMNNCQGLEDSTEPEYQLNSPQLQRHHVESFAASLAICDLERGRFIIPDACTLFTSSALIRAAGNMKGNLQVSAEQVGVCLEALGQDHSHWNTWLSYRDKAFLFCQASRIDIDKGMAYLALQQQHINKSQISQYSCTNSLQRSWQT